MLTSWTHIGPTVVAAFLASLVEFVEALTVVLAIGVVRGWRGALVGSGTATLTLLAIIALLGPLLTRIPLDTIQLAVGVLLLLFGMRWLRKAILRASGIIAMHDEASIFAEQEAALRQMEGSRGGLDTVAVIAAFKITMLEGIEVVFIVIALGAGGKGLLIPASLGALAALLVVIAVGAAVHRPLSRVPENTLKFVVGVLLSAFGTFWVGEGLGLTWPGEDWSIPGLIAGFLVVALIAVPIARAIRARRTGLMARDAA
jgi:Ca2+/H+ antiporter, TMEM165/GDT1 family